MTASVPTMCELPPKIQTICDTALWVASFRAMESQRNDALFSDPYAKRLAGERGFQLAENLPQKESQELACVVRTYLFDLFLSRLLQEGTDLVLNLGAGLDARPYRMDLPADLQWIEVDLPEIISYKEEILAGAKARCKLERMAIDITDEQGRGALFPALDRRANKVVVLCEGVLVYFTPMEVATLARDLAMREHFQSWIVDLWSTIQLILMQRTVGKGLAETAAEFKFGPPEGVDFFKALGWGPEEIRGLLKTAAQFNRAPKELLVRLPEPEPIPPNYPWAGVCLLRRQPESSYFN